MQKVNCKLIKLTEKPMTKDKINAINKNRWQFSKLVKAKFYYLQGCEFVLEKTVWTDNTSFLFSSTCQ